MPKDYRFLGKVTPRKDALEIVTGKAKYIDDIRPAAVLHGKVLRSPYAHAEVRIPASAANAVQRFSKFRLRESIDFAVVSVAAVLDVSEGVCRNARIVLGAVAPVPYRAVAAKGVLRNGPLDER